MPQSPIEPEASSVRNLCPALGRSAAKGLARMETRRSICSPSTASPASSGASTESVPKLFSFLRQAGISLPEGPSEQRRLYEGGADSLLAKYVAKFVDRPADFWSTTLTPEVAQSRLIGDADQTILDLARRSRRHMEGT